MMMIRSTQFIKSSTRLKDCPAVSLPEIAFIGRSNVGKSSLINMLANQARLARTSSTPGKTQLINHFLVNGSWYIVDLPGYGYTKMPVGERKKMMKMIREYVLGRESLVCLLLLIDARLDMQKADSEFLTFLGKNQVPFVLVFTKTDKVSPGRLDRHIQQYKQNLLRQWESLPPVFLTSSLKRTGRDELLDFIRETLQ